MLYEVITPAGTGKTYLAVAMAVKAFKAHSVNKIILTRPAVEAGEKLGFLPGDLQDKVDPYLRPLYDALFDMLGAEAFRITSYNVCYTKLLRELKFYKMEGYFFPDTYDFYIGTDPEYVVEVIKLNFNKKVYNAYYTKMKEKNLTLDEVITLASIVQREAANISDMKMVASVFWNRLNNSSTFPLLVITSYSIHYTKLYDLIMVLNFYLSVIIYLFI